MSPVALFDEVQFRSVLLAVDPSLVIYAISRGIAGADSCQADLAVVVAFAPSPITLGDICCWNCALFQSTGALGRSHMRKLPTIELGLHISSTVEAPGGETSPYERMADNFI